MGPLRSVPLASTRNQNAASREADDAPLVRRTREGDEDGFAELYRRYRPEIYNVCLRRLRDPGAAEDVTQETFIRAFANLHRFDQSRRMLPWLVSIATRRCIDLRRLGERTPKTEVIDLADHESVEEDPTLDAVVAGEERRRLERALRRLAPRQRRALLLHALEGWSYADIAAAEGVSISSTKSLLFHARLNLRRSCRRGLLATLLVPVGAIRDRARRIADGLRARGSSVVEPLASAAAPVTSGIAAVVLSLAAVAPPATSAAAGMLFGSPSNVTLVSAGGSRGGAGLASPAGPGGTKTRGLVDSLLNPTDDATPEDTQFTSIAASPNYEEDRTLLAAGRVPCQQSSCMVLFASRDGGATWSRLGSDQFNGHTVLLPPSYPRDPRIFAMGSKGLEVSSDGGDTFKVVVPIQGDVAMSPRFNADDPRILIGATVVTEYWANRDLLKPATLVGPAGTWLTIAFSPAYAQDHTIFVGGITPDAAGRMRPTVNRCSASVCQNVVFAEGFDAPWLRPSPAFARDKTVYAFTSHALFRSTDGATTFTSLSPDFAVEGSISDVLTSGAGEVLAAVGGSARSRGGLYHSSDGGRSWAARHIALPGFGSAVNRIVALPDGHLIALGSVGIACSGDGGLSWASRCSA